MGVGLVGRLLALVVACGSVLHASGPLGGRGSFVGSSARFRASVHIFCVIIWVTVWALALDAMLRCFNIVDDRLCVRKKILYCTN